MTKNEQLRCLLDECGWEWEAFDDFEQTTQWSTYNGAFVYWARERDGELLVETTAPIKCSASCTPEQAIAITIGCNAGGSKKQCESWRKIEYENIGRIVMENNKLRMLARYMLRYYFIPIALGSNELDMELLDRAIELELMDNGELAMIEKGE